LNHVRPFASRAFTATAKEEMEILMGLKCRHDLAWEKQQRSSGSSGKFVLFLEDEAMHLMNGRGIIA
jgi:hypothetical protein